MNDELINPGRGGHAGIPAADPVGNGKQHRHRHDAVVVEGDHVGVARAGSGHEPRLVDRRHLVVVGLETAQGRHILPRAVAPDRHGPQSPAVSRVDREDLAGFDLEPLESRALRRARLSARRDPLEQHAMLPGAAVEPLAAVVVDLLERLGEDQALLRVGDGCAGLVASHQVGMVVLEVVSEEREHEAPLPLKRTVAGTAVAAEPAEQRHDVATKIGLLERGDSCGKPLIDGGHDPLRPGRGGSGQDRECRQHQQDPHQEAPLGCH